MERDRHSLILSHSALIGVSALASAHIPASQIIILPLLFTAGMTFVDSCDSIFMLHAYALPSWGEGQGRWYQRAKLWEARSTTAVEGDSESNEVKLEIPAVVASESLVTVQILLTVISIMIALLISIVSRRFDGFDSSSLTLCL